MKTSREIIKVIYNGVNVDAVKTVKSGGGKWVETIRTVIGNNVVSSKIIGKVK